MTDSSTTQKITLNKLYTTALVDDSLEHGALKVRTPSPCAQSNAPGSLGGSRDLDTFIDEGVSLGKAYRAALLG